MRRSLASGVMCVLVLGMVASMTRAAEQPGYGATPQIPEPKESWLPILKWSVASEPWPEGMTPKAAEGLSVQAFAKDLKHPRWLHVLPNGDVLVAESNKPPQEESSMGIRRWVAEKVMGSAGANTPSANRISLSPSAAYRVSPTRPVRNGRTAPRWNSCNPPACQ